MKTLAMAVVAVALSTGAAAQDGKFLADNARATGVKSLPGIQVQVLRSGPAEGAQPTRTSGVKVRYIGRFADGSVFDQSIGKTPEGTAIFPVRGVIPGFQSAVMMMRPGDRWRVVIPPELAYGAVGHKLSARVLEFEIELIDWAELPPVAPPTLTELPKR